MKKHLLINLIGLFLFMSPIYADNGDYLSPKECGIENALVYEPINEIEITFEGIIGIAADVKALITFEGNTMATGTITSRNYKTQGIATITFENLILPKGKSYKLEIPSGAIYLKDDPTVKTKNIKIDFEVPASIPLYYCSVENGSTIISARSIWFYYKTETEPIGNPTMTLYREGVPMNTFNAHVGWDWNLGQAYADFGMTINFEKGVHYSLVFPEGSLTPRFRTDITNEESRVDFVGGYTEPAEPVTCVWCSLFDDPNIDEINVVRFFYNQAIILSPDPKIQLFDGDNNLIKEVTPVLTKEKEYWVVSCDFGGIKIPESGCYITIPEGTVISAEDNERTNTKNSFSLKIETGVDKVSSGNLEIKVYDKRIIIDNAPLGETISVYSVDGKKVADRLVSSRYFILELESNGIYIVSINGKSYKVAI